MYIYANTPQIIPIRPLEWRRKGSTIETRERNLTEKKIGKKDGRRDDPQRREENRQEIRS